MIARKRRELGRIRPPKNPRHRPHRELPPKRKAPKLQKKKQVAALPTARMKELIEEVLEAISDFMVDGNLWVSEHEVQELLRKKQVFFNLKDQEVTEALELATAFGLVMRTQNSLYSLPKRVFNLLEEGKMPDWEEMMKDWNERPKRVGWKRICQCSTK